MHRLLPDDGEVAGLLALMLLTDARRAARTGPDGELIPLDEQDRSLWDRALIAEGVALVSATCRKASVGPYQLQAAIAAVHDEAARAEDTDWPQILALYRLARSACPTTRWSRSITRSPRRWCRDLPQGLDRSCGARCRGRASQDIIASTPSGRICWRWPATATAPSPTTGVPPTGPPACRNGTTS